MTVVSSDGTQIVLRRASLAAAGWLSSLDPPSSVAPSSKVVTPSSNTGVKIGLLAGFAKIVLLRFFVSDLTSSGRSSRIEKSLGLRDVRMMEDHRDVCLRSECWWSASAIMSLARLMIFAFDAAFAIIDMF